jgi:hypothetical protein
VVNQGEEGDLIDDKSFKAIVEDWELETD